MNFYLAQIIQGTILTGMIISAFLLMKSKDLFISVIYLSIMSLMLATEFYILQAPDVAIAEAAVGAALSSAIYILAIYKTNRFEK
ncbi:MAG: DUF4040 domain-containing protein [Xanthomonadaceae bacterium]|nr:DUF4040 domain-containing protein [Rhodospirillaceae bacterium]NIA17749.1 DUF4040 domain-containing protein [Xanthomonadaceae bacterium]